MMSRKPAKSHTVKKRNTHNSASLYTPPESKKQRTCEPTINEENLIEQDYGATAMEVDANAGDVAQGGESHNAVAATASKGWDIYFKNEYLTDFKI